MPASDELQDEANVDELLKGAPKMRPAGTLRFRERQAVMDIYQQLLDRADDKGNLSVPNQLGPLNRLLADVDEALETYAVSSDAYVKWSQGQSAAAMFALFGRYGGEVAKLLSSAD